MSIHYSIYNNQDHLRTEVSGNWTPGKESEEMIRFGQKVADTCREFAVNRILTINNISGLIQIWDAHKVVTSMASFGWDRSFRQAVVYTHEERFESNLFTERLAVSRGLRIKIFRDESSAKAWLLELSTACYSRKKSIKIFETFSNLQVLGPWFDR